MQQRGTNEKRLLFSPSGSNRFIIYGSSDIKLSEWRPSIEQLHPSRQALRSLTVLTDLPAFRALAWSKHAATDDLVAIGLQTGRTLLVRLTDPVAHQPSPANSSAPYHSVSLNVRQQRPVNAVAFSSTEPNLLAVALEKARDHAVHIFDIERSVRLLEAKLDGSWIETNTEAAASPARTRTSDARQSISPAPEAKPFTLLGSGEVANSILFLNTGSGHSSQLVVGIGGKTIRTYDIRERPQSASQSFSGSQASTALPERSTRAVYGLAGDPFDGHRFASHDDAGVIKLWDARYAADAVLTFSEGDSLAGTVAGDRQLSVPGAAKRSGGLLGMHFSPSRRGVLASLDANTSSVHLWDIWQGAGRWAEPPSNEDDNDAFVPPILSQSSLCRPFAKPPASFAFANTSSSPSSMTLCSVSREGHIEFLQHNDPVRTAWSADGDFAALQGAEVTIWSSNEAAESALAAAGSRIRSLPSSMPQSIRPSFSRLSSAYSERTPRPNGKKRHASLQDEDIRTVVDRLVQLKDLEAEEDTPNAVASDISTLMKARVHLGYGAEAARNAKLTTEGLSEFWTWIDHADQMATKSRSIVDKYDFAYTGTLPLLRGVPSVFDRNKPPAEPSRSATPVSFNIVKEPVQDATQAHEEVARALRRTANLSSAAAEAARNENAYNSAVQQFVDQNGITSYVKVASKKLLARRKLALAMCGPEFASDDRSAVARRAEEAGHAERATAWAVYSGNIEDAVHALRASKDERLKLLAPTLASYAARPQDNAAFGELYSSLSTDLDDPYLRSVFAYLADKSWLDVLDEQALPLRDRIGIALRYLADDELLRFLDQLAKSLVADGDLEGIAITGLTGLGFQLLQNYLDRTGDVQTVALAVSHVHPGRLSEARAERWITTYRRLLDSWRLFVPRARFDVARGARLRKTQELLASVGAPVEPVDMAPTRLLIRCNYCNKTITPLKGDMSLASSRTVSPAPPVQKGRQRSGETRGQRSKPTNCPWCHKSFPRCSICLVSLSVPETTEEVEPPPAWCWCQRCRHGGHAAHLSEWFKSHVKCCVADCECECTMI